MARLGSQPPGRTRRWVIVVVGIGLGALLLVFRTGVLRLAWPLERAFTFLGSVTGNAWTALFSGAREAERAQSLEQQRNELASQAARAERLEDENAELRLLLSYSERTRYRLVSAAIIMRSVAPQTKTFVIDRGTDDGVVEGAAVLSGDGILIGKITSTTSATATVTATTDPTSKTAASLLNRSRTIGLAEGGTASLMNMRYIPHDEDIRINDLVITSGLEPTVPAGLLIGIVNAVEKDPTAAFQEAVVEPLLDIRRITTVAVVTDHL